MTGFHGQKFDFIGEGGSWYALISELPTMHVNMRVTSPVPSLPKITYITGLSVITADDDGLLHTVVITVKDPHNLNSGCPGGVSPCLADGSLSVVLDGRETLREPGSVMLGPDVEVFAVNLPGECRSFGFEKYWEREKREYALQADHRRLGESVDMGEWILGDPTATNMVERTEYVARAMADKDGLFSYQSEHASIQIVTLKATIRLSHGRLHQLAMRDPTDRFDIPEHLTWQMNMAIDRTGVSRTAKGVLGETFVPTLNSNGAPIMHGMEAIRGTEADCEWSGLCSKDMSHEHTRVACDQHRYTTDKQQCARVIVARNSYFTTAYHWIRKRFVVMIKSFCCLSSNTRPPRTYVDSSMAMVQQKACYPSH